MIIHTQIDFNDILALQQDVIHYSYTHYIKKLYYKWILAVVLFLVILFAFGPSLTSAAASAIVTAVFILLFPRLYRNVAYARAKSQMENQDYSRIIGPCDFTLNESGIERNINGSTTYFPWSEFTRLGEDDTHYFLYQTDLNGLILPKQPNDLNDSEATAFQSYIEKVKDKTDRIDPPQS